MNDLKDRGPRVRMMDRLRTGTITWRPQLWPALVLTDSREGQFPSNLLSSFTGTTVNSGDCGTRPLSAWMSSAIILQSLSFPHL